MKCTSGTSRLASPRWHGRAPLGRPGGGRSLRPPGRVLAGAPPPLLQRHRRARCRRCRSGTAPTAGGLGGQGRRQGRPHRGGGRLEAAAQGQVEGRLAGRFGPVHVDILGEQEGESAAKVGVRRRRAGPPALHKARLATAARAAVGSTVSRSGSASRRSLSGSYCGFSELAAGRKGAELQQKTCHGDSAALPRYWRHV